MAVALVATVVSAAVAAAATVQVTGVDGSSSRVDLTSLRGSEDVQGRDYAIRSGSREERRTITGFSLAAILEHAGVDGFSFTYLEVSRPGGAPVLLDVHQVRDADAFADGPPVISESGGQAQFTRPSRGSDDANAADSFVAEPLSIQLRDGRLIEVEASASRTRVDPREPVRFSAAVERAAAAAQVEFSWSFNDGTSAPGESVTHRFAKPGTYDVVVGATTASDETGGYDTVTVQVGEPPDRGPDRKGGGNNKSDGAPDSGAATGASGTGGGGSGAGTGGSTAPVESGASAGSPAAAAARDAQQPQTAAGERVIGELLRGVAAPVEPAESPASSAEEAVAARTGSGEPEEGASPPGVVIGALSLLALLGAGAALELELLRIPRPRPLGGS